MIFPIPYTIFIYLAGAVLNPFALAVVSGIGAGIGELSGYALGYFGEGLVNKRYGPRLKAFAKLLDQFGPIAIFLFALTPLPDDLLFIPLGMSRYGLLKALIPSIIGKFFMSLILAYAGYYSIGFVSQLYGEGGWLGVVLTTVFLILVIVAMIRIDWEKLAGRYLAKK